MSRRMVVAVAIVSNDCAESEEQKLAFQELAPFPTVQLSEDNTVLNASKF